MEKEKDKDKETKVPARVFIVPYRNRPQHKFFFSKYMSFILENETDYEIYFSHQHDTRPFNRGASKNLGFMAIRDKYPNDYKDITFIFNDTDVIPFNKIFSYQTVSGTVAHYYGFDFTLGGIVVIKGRDFERINGFPCYWGWGMEDNALQKRVLKANLTIDRSHFYKIGSPEILQLFDGVSRVINKHDPWREHMDTGLDGIQTLTQVSYSIDPKSANNADNLFAVHNPLIFFINVSNFDALIPFESDAYYHYDLREPKRSIINPQSGRKLTTTGSVTTREWSIIPHVPTTHEHRENHARQLMNSGREVPKELVRQIQQDKLDHVFNDSYNRNIDRNDRNTPSSYSHSPLPSSHSNPINRLPAAAYKGPPKATSSARIRLGGAY